MGGKNPIDTKIRIPVPNTIPRRGTTRSNMCRGSAIEKEMREEDRTRYEDFTNRRESQEKEGQRNTTGIGSDGRDGGRTLSAPSLKLGERREVPK